MVGALATGGSVHLPLSFRFALQQVLRLRREALYASHIRQWRWGALQSDVREGISSAAAHGVGRTTAASPALATVMFTAGTEKVVLGGHTAPVAFELRAAVEVGAVAEVAPLLHRWRSGGGGPVAVEVEAKVSVPLLGAYNHAAAGVCASSCAPCSCA